MAGFSGAVEDGVRNMGMVVSLVVALVLGYAYGSIIVGVGAFVAGSLIASIWAAHAGESFRARQIAGEIQEDGEASSNSREP